MTGPCTADSSQIWHLLSPIIRRWGQWCRTNWEPWREARDHGVKQSKISEPQKASTTAIPTCLVSSSQSTWLQGVWYTQGPFGHHWGLETLFVTAIKQCLWTMLVSFSYKYHLHFMLMHLQDWKQPSLIQVWISKGTYLVFQHPARCARRSREHESKHSSAFYCLSWNWSTIHCNVLSQTALNFIALK